DVFSSDLCLGDRPPCREEADRFGDVVDADDGGAGGRRPGQRRQAAGQALGAPEGGGAGGWRGGGGRAAALGKGQEALAARPDEQRAADRGQLRQASQQRQGLLGGPGAGGGRVG